MKLPIYQIDAFAEKAFEGNPAAVVPLAEWLSEASMQAIAAENNLAETAFFVPTDKGFHIRWFTPSKEVSLCGHATLASAYVIFNDFGYKEETIVFTSLSGSLSVRKCGEALTLNFPAQVASPCQTPALLSQALGKAPVECYAHEDYLAVYENASDVLNLRPDHNLLTQLDLRGVIVTAPARGVNIQGYGAEGCDFIVRFFAPNYGISEDSVTGSAYTKLTPYWADKLAKTTLTAKQVSLRGGKVLCKLEGSRVLISGRAIKYMEGTIEVCDE